MKQKKVWAPRVTFRCPNCNMEFTKKVDEPKDGDIIQGKCPFCSSECQTEFKKREGS